MVCNCFYSDFYGIFRFKSIASMKRFNFFYILKTSIDHASDAFLYVSYLLLRFRMCAFGSPVYRFCFPKLYKNYINSTDVTPAPPLPQNSYLYLTQSLNVL